MILIVADVMDKIREIGNIQKELDNISEFFTDEHRKETIENANDLLMDYIKMLGSMKVVESR